MTENDRIILQIQPVYRRKEEYEAFAEDRDLSYELLEPSLFLYLDDAEWTREALSFYKNTGRAASFHGAFIDVSPVSRDPLIREASRKRIVQSFEKAKTAGCTDILFHADAHPFLSAAYAESWAERTAAYYTDLSEEYGMKVHIENSLDVYPDALFCLAEKLRGTENVDICLDIGHANYSRTDLPEWFRKMGEKIGYLHLSDNSGFYDEHAPLGAGTVDWKTADALWRAWSGARKITIEMNSFEDMKTSLAYLRDRHYFEF